jgi:transglutaminase superfamily protein
MPLREAYELGLLARGVHMPPGKSALTLYDTTLVEDDGPGSRPLSTGWPTIWETVGGGTQVRKLLTVDRPKARRATLILCGMSTRGEAEPLVITINGHAVEYKCPHKELYPDRWHSIAFPVGWLRKGRNTVVLSCAGPGGWWVSIASKNDIVANAPERRQTAGTRSQRSIDGGRTWRGGLGPDGALSGEYMVRLRLDQYAREGELIGQVIDMAAGASGDDGLVGPVKVQSLQLTATKRTPSGTTVELAVRTGSSPLYEAAHWGPWRPCKAAAVKPSNAGHRFAQWRVVLKTRSGTATPSVTGVTLKARAEVPRAAWWRGVSTTDAHNETVRFTSTGFEYERTDHAQLKKLRRKYQLDKVVAGARDELEAMRLLRDWVAHQFCWAPPGQPYPTWDAHDILSRKDNMCVQSSITLMQCALALGLQARFTFGIFPNATAGGKHAGGHEVTEVWSNQFGKWVYMDATSTRNECYVNRKTGIPLSMLEMHDETVRLYCRGKPISLVRNVTRAEKTTSRLKVWKGRAKRPSTKPAPVRYRWGIVHWMPRNNFFAKRRPVPIAQGRIGWSWPGYLIWWDAQTPRQMRFANHTCRRSDIEWTINQVRYAATAGAKPGAVDIRMGTVTPDFETFLARIDGGPWTPVGKRMTWQLEPGSNRIEMCVRTTAGVLGNTSWLEVDYGNGG